MRRRASIGPAVAIVLAAAAAYVGSSAVDAQAPAPASDQRPTIGRYLVGLDKAGIGVRAQTLPS